MGPEISEPAAVLSHLRYSYRVRISTIGRQMTPVSLIETQLDETELRLTSAISTALSATGPMV